MAIHTHTHFYGHQESTSTVLHWRSCLDRCCRRRVCGSISSAHGWRRCRRRRCSNTGGRRRWRSVGIETTSRGHGRHRRSSLEGKGNIINNLQEKLIKQQQVCTNYGGKSNSGVLTYCWYICPPGGTGTPPGPKEDDIGGYGTPPCISIIGGGAGPGGGGGAIIELSGKGGGGGGAMGVVN